MIFFRTFEKVHNLLHFSFALVESSYISEFNCNIFYHVKLLFLLGRHLLAHGSLRCTHNSGNDEGNEEKVKSIINLTKKHLDSCSTQIAILCMSLLHYFFKQLLKG